MMTRAAVAVLALVSGAAWAGDLDGTQWKLRPEGAKSALFWKQQTLNFDKSLFSSSNTMEKGFRPSPYVTMEEGSAMTWSASQVSDTGEQIQWHGVRNGDEMKGSYTLMGTDGKVKSQRWKATLQGESRGSQRSGGTEFPGGKKRGPKSPPILNAGGALERAQ